MKGSPILNRVGLISRYGPFYFLQSDSPLCIGA